MRVRFVGLVISALVIVLDQVSKWWILESVMRPPRLIEITSFFNIVLVWNPGISFGMFRADSAEGRWALTALALAITVGLLVWMVRNTRLSVAVAIGLIVGGALGNVIDRIRFGAVVDFLDFHVSGWHWPAFNVADSAITVGAVLLIVDALFFQDRSR